MVAVQMSFFLVFLPELFPSVVMIAIVLICYDLNKGQAALFSLALLPVVCEKYAYTADATSIQRQAFQLLSYWYTSCELPLSVAFFVQQNISLYHRDSHDLAPYKENDSYEEDSILHRHHISVKNSAVTYVSLIKKKAGTCLAKLVHTNTIIVHTSSTGSVIIWLYS